MESKWNLVILVYRVYILVYPPSKVVDLRMKNFELLRYLQQLFDDGSLSLDEYNEQKKNILTCLRKL